MLNVIPVNTVYTSILLSQNRKKIPDELPAEGLIQIANENPVIDTFLKLAVIPTPTVRPGHPKESEMKENMRLVRQVTAKLFEELHPEITSYIDKYGSLIIKVPGSKGYEDRQPLMFMGHLDIVPADLDEPTRQIYPVLINHPAKEGIKEYIATDGTTTLGADDKAQVAIIWDIVRRFILEEKAHVPFEIILAPDEEEDSASLIALDTSQSQAKYVIVADDDEAFKITTGCASFVDIKIDISGLRGSHSGIDNRDDFINASDILMELGSVLGNGVVKWNPEIHQPLISKNIYEYEIKRSPSNALPTEGHMYLSLRSLSKEEQNNELERIRQEVKRIEEKYKLTEKNLEIKIKTDEQFPPWQGSTDNLLVKLLQQAANETEHHSVKIIPSHGASQANHLVSKRNAYAEEFVSVVVGSDLEGLHTVTEKADWRSLVEVSDWLYKFVQMYTVFRAQ